MRAAGLRRASGAAMIIAALLAVLPPLYLWGSGVDAMVLGLPFGVWYMIFDGLLISVAVTVLYLVEQHHGETE